MTSRAHDQTDRDIDRIRQTYGYNTEETRNALARRLRATAWLTALDPGDGARAAFQELAEARISSEPSPILWEER